MFEGFDLGDVLRLEVRSWTVGPGRSAELLAIEVEVYRQGKDEPELTEITFVEGEGPTAGLVEQLVRVLNRRLQQRGGQSEGG